MMHNIMQVIKPDDGRPLIAQQHRLLFCIVSSLFFLWAIPNNLNDILVRQFYKSFELSRFEAGLVQSAFYFGYFVFSLPAAMILSRCGYKFGLLTGLSIYALGCLLFWPAALANTFTWFLLALFTIAAGLAFLETGASALVVLLGAPETSARRLNLAQAFNPPGTIAGALIGTFFIFSGKDVSPETVARMKSEGVYAAALHAETLRVIAPYVVLACAVALVAIVLCFVRFPPTLASEQEEREGSRTFGTLAHSPRFRGAVLSQFFYVGAQVGTWSYLIQYGSDYTGTSDRMGGYILSFSLVLFALGRVAATAMMKFIAPAKLLLWFALVNVGLMSVAVIGADMIGFGALVLSSFFMSLMYPTNFALGLRGLGGAATLGASILVMAIIGGAICTPLIGLVAGMMGGLAAGFIVPLGCYLVIVLFALSCIRAKESERDAD